MIEYGVRLIKGKFYALRVNNDTKLNHGSFVVVHTEKGEEVAVPVDPAKPFAAQVIKTIADPFVGKISIVKVYQGALTPDAAVVNARTGKGEKCSNLSVMIGKKSENISKINAGDIGAIAKLQQTVTGDTLCAANAKITFAPIAFSEPCISLAVTANKQG